MTAYIDSSLKWLSKWIDAFKKQNTWKDDKMKDQPDPKDHPQMNYPPTTTDP